MIALKEKTLAKISRLSRVLQIVFIVVFAALIVMLLLSALLFACGCFGYEFFVSEGAWSPSDPGFSQRELVTEGATMLLYAALAGLSFFFAARMFGRIAKTKRPFERDRARELKLVAWLNIAASIAPGILAVAVSTAGFGDPYVPDGFSIDYDAILNSVILLAFAYIFDYGCMLQQQDDELL